MRIYPSIRQLKIFAAVTREGSFGKAASALGMTQSAVSQSVAQLENMVKVRLFERTTRNVSVTEPGAALLQRLDPILCDLDSAFRDLEEIAAARTGMVKVITTPSLSARFYPMINELFRRQHPDIQLVQLDDSTLEIATRLKRGEATMALGPSLAADRTITFEPLLADEYRVIFSKSHPLAVHERVPWDEVLKFEFVAVTRNAQLRLELEAVLPDPASMMRSAYQVSSIDGLFAPLKDGLALTVGPAMGCPGDDHPYLCHRAIAEPIPWRIVGLNILTAHILNPAESALRSVMMQAARSAETRIPHVRSARRMTGRFPS